MPLNSQLTTSIFASALTLTHDFLPLYCFFQANQHALDTFLSLP